jgi:quercetin dioxygenase-like cupin family protein
MTVFKYAEMDVAAPVPNTLRRQAHGEHIMVTVVDFVNGPCPAAPPHQHPHEQITYVAGGRVNFVIGTEAERTVHTVEAGDLIVVPPDAPHTVEVLTERARLIDCFYPIREDFLSE